MHFPSVATHTHISVPVGPQIAVENKAPVVSQIVYNGVFPLKKRLSISICVRGAVGPQIALYNWFSLKHG